MTNARFPASLAPVLPLLLTLTSCAASYAPLSATMEPLPLTNQQAPLTEDHFQKDKSASISEEAIRRILEAPVFLEERARVGVVPVSWGYRTDSELPLTKAPAAVGEALERSGQFEVVTECSTDWPVDSGIGGLRELAARYGTEYLLLYRHRFVDREWTNGWGAMWLTIVGGFVVPESTIEVAGVLEATLFDVKSGTLLFTVFERVHERSNEFLYDHERIVLEMQGKLAEEGAKRLADTVSRKISSLAAARPDRTRPALSTEAPVAPLPSAEPTTSGAPG